MDMIERVARALADNRDGDTWDVKSEDGDGFGYMGKNDYRALARAAIEAMREPTEAMRQAGYALTVDDESDVYEAMIDAALKEKPPA